ncbi:multidrug efflux ABC transporter permease LieB [Micromonospora polyrhachis]|uniref:Transport permease protein n=1 Tax=Micromonospora polyrhachis TaxID=1282883 RepID=A0A7W7SND2_9ACTN|nr:ABC transporter permease [Micromonospora polyrhachis]MBB4957816.1 ABC-2 type transport system permease protein [Micromonospora polyrhachis]
MTTHSAFYWAASDSLTMVGRSLRHTRRNFDSLLLTVLLPTIMLLMFVYVFGGAITTGFDQYVNYVVPGIILLSTGYGASSTAVSVANDMVNGIVDRFRSLPILSTAVLTGHVVASVARNVVATALVVGLALLVGFRPNAEPVEWMATIALLLLYILAMSWLAVALGLLAGNVESASGFTVIILFLPYLSSAFVPTGTMPTVLRQFSEHQPITPMTETVRGLLMGTPIGASAMLSLAWFGGILVLAYLAAGYLFKRRAARS